MGSRRLDLSSAFQTFQTFQTLFFAPMLSDAAPSAAHAFVDLLARLLEYGGVGIIIAGVVLASGLFVRAGLRNRDWQAAYEGYRSNLGRGILLGLELLVGADIISTITSPLTVESVGLLAGIVAIRTFLSFSLETEIEGCWPWRRAQVRAGMRDGGEGDGGRA